MILGINDDLMMVSSWSFNRIVLIYCLTMERKTLKIIHTIRNIVFYVIISVMESGGNVYLTSIDISNIQSVVVPEWSRFLMGEPLSSWEHLNSTSRGQLKPTSDFVTATDIYHASHVKACVLYTSCSIKIPCHAFFCAPQWLQLILVLTLQTL